MTSWDTAGSKSRNESVDWTAALFEWTKFTDYIMLSRNPYCIRDVAFTNSIKPQIPT